jgi:transposase
MIWIGVDAHKQVHQAVAISEAGLVGEQTIANSEAAWAALLEWAQQWPERIWAVEGAWYLGRGLAQFLAGRGERVHELNGRWTARRRRGMRRPGTSDRLDARSVATLLREEADTLPRVFPEQDPEAIVQLVSREHATLNEEKTRVVNRLHALLLQCDPASKTSFPDLQERAAITALQTYTAPGPSALARERERAVRRQAAQLALLDEQERALERQLKAASRERFSPLTRIEGIGPIIACGIVAELGRPRPGFREEHLAADAGIAPLEASSAGGTRHRLNRTGNRRLNMFFHQIVLTQGRIDEPARAYLARRRREGLTDRDARRALKRHLVRRVYRAWLECFTSNAERIAA